MKAVVVVLMAAVLTMPCKGVETDKMAHLGISYLATTASYGLLKCAGIEKRWVRLLVSSLAVVTAGTIKELTDKRFDKKDMLANSIGIGTAVGMAVAFEF